MEIEQTVERLQKFSGVDQFLDFSQFINHHSSLQSLNIQAHECIKQESDDFVSQELIHYQKVEILVHNLICQQLFRERLFPAIKDCLTNTNYTLVYTMLYNEIVTLNLLELVLFHPEAFADESECFLDLVDYCVRAVTDLQPYFEEPPSIEQAKEDKSDHQTVYQNLLKQMEGMRFTRGIICLSILRYLTDQITRLPFSVMHRLLDTHDTICILVALIESHPWRCQRGSNDAAMMMMVFEDNDWRSVAAGEEERLSKVEAQVWLSLYNLLVEPECRKKYEYTEYRQRTVLKLRPYFRPSLLDQLPLLAQLYRSVEELSIMTPPVTKAPGSMIQQVPEIADRLMSNFKLTETASVLRTLLTNLSPSIAAQLAQVLSGVYDLDRLESVVPDDPKCECCGAMAMQRCSRCRNAWYCGRKCQVKAWKGHKTVCDLVSNDL